MNHYISSFSLLLIILLFNCLLCINKNLKSDNDFPLQYRLNNGNYIVIVSKGIYLYDENFTFKNDIKVFESRIFNEYNDAYPTNIAQFSSEDSGYIICLVKNQLYILSKDGIYLTNYELNFIQYSNIIFYPILPYGHSGNDFYFIIIVKESNNIICKKFIYNSNDNIVSFNTHIYYDSGDNQYNSITCELMNYFNDKVIACCYGNWYAYHFKVFNLTEFKPISGMETDFNNENDGGQIFKSNIIKSERTKAAFCIQRSNDLKCFTYNVNTNTIGDILTITNGGCDCQHIDMMVEYFPEREEFVFWCVSHYDIYIGRLSKDDYYEQFNGIMGLINESLCDEPKRFNLFYSSTSQKYVVLTDTDCQTLYTIDSIEANKIKDYPVDGQVICDNYYSYDKSECYTDVPYGYYCNDTNLKTIDKCHDNCETCKKGPTNDNDNCLTCKGTKYLDLGNCEDSCNNGNYIDSDGINKCKCSTDIKCEYCSIESKEYNLCISCNNEEGYYPKINDNSNIDSFINCYNNIEGYYLDKSTNIFKKCYSTCKKCNELGNEDNNKCIECISTHDFKTDFKNDNNCYQKCDNYYYFDSSNKYHCINDCPNDFKKLIVSKKKCINNCINDDKYKYEFKNICYEECPSNTIPSSDNNYICEEKKEDEDQCKITQNELISSNDEVSINYINSLTKFYAKNFFSTNYYVSTYKNNYMSIYIYNNISCLIKKTGTAPEIDFGECYNKVKNFYNISEDLIISIININKNNTKPITTYAFSDPITGEILNSTKVCFNEKIVIQEDVKALMKNIDDKKEELIYFCTNQGINVFNLSDNFYNDICFHFESPNRRDIPLKDRISIFYPNITLCDKGCENKGVDLETLKAKCVCAFNDIMSNELLSDNIYLQNIEEVMDVLKSLNIEVVKCIKDIFYKKYFFKCHGSFIFISFFVFQIICLSIFFGQKLYDIRKYFFSLCESYFNYISNNNAILKNNKSKSGL